MPPTINYKHAQVTFAPPGKNAVTHNVVTEARASLNRNNMNGGTGPSGAILPPGWGGGTCPCHHNRGHLIGNRLGGPGDEPDNLVTLTAGANHPVMYEFEEAVFKIVSSSQPGTHFTYVVECSYSDYYHAGIGFPVPGASGNPFCLFPAPAALRLSLEQANGTAATINDIRVALGQSPVIGPVGLEKSVAFPNGIYKLYDSPVHTAQSCWSVTADPNNLVIQQNAAIYAAALGY